MFLGGVGSFWLVTGEKDDPKLVLEDLEETRRPDPPMVSPLTSTIRANAAFELPETVEAFYSPGQHKIRTFTTVTRLAAGYSPRDIGFDEVVSRLREGSLSIPVVDVIAIEVRPGDWITSQFVRQPSGLYGLAPGVDVRSMLVTTIENRPESMRLPSGLMVFLSQPRWSLAQESDLRPEHEVLQSAEKWLARSKLAADRPHAESGDIVETLRHFVATTVDPDEKADLTAAVRQLARHQSLLDVMPQLLARDPVFQERLKEFELQERERLKDALQAKLETEIQAEKSRLAKIRTEIADAETRLTVAGQREVLLRNEAEKHDEAIRTRIAVAAKQIQSSENARDASLREEMSLLREMVSTLKQQAPAPLEAPVIVKAEDREDNEATAERHADEDARKSIVSGLSAAIGLTAADIAAILLRSTEDIPVLIGERASSTAADIVAAVGGEGSAVVFCDPSRISWQDLMRDETSGLATAVANAKSNPDVLVPVAVCGITNGPCEYWIPQFVESRRIGRLPRNLAIVASAGVDGMRVSVPDSILRFLMPVEVPDAAKEVRKMYAGCWSADLDFDRGRLADAVHLLSQADTLKADVLQRTAKLLSRTPPGVAMADVGKVFLRNAQWLANISADGQYEFKNHFKNIEG
ncbi:hypothetical protein HJA90_09570 [Rhizobium bangladeshense]|nr:hypothetical protein [Rhizobium bangladeshense]